VAIAVIATHGALITWWAVDRAPEPLAETQASDPESFIAFLLPRERPPPDAVPLPQLHLPQVRVDDTAPTQLVFGDPDWDLVPGVIGAVSAPHPDSTQSRDTDLFAIRAGLQPGQVQNVVLSVQVLADGSVGQLSVISSSGNPAVDEEAMSYVLSLQWTPGSRNRHATDMRISWPVTLVANASAIP
jgi:TonB family protein